MALTKLKPRPRTKAILIEVISSAQRLYLETGGQDIDRAIEAVQATHDLALHRAKRYIPPENGRGRDPLSDATKAAHELRMLLQQREKKLAQCRKDVDEMAEADRHKWEPEQYDGTRSADDAAGKTGNEPEVPEYIPAPMPEPTEADDCDTPEGMHDQSSA